METKEITTAEAIRLGERRWLVLWGERLPNGYEILHTERCATMHTALARVSELKRQKKSASP